MAPTRGTPVDIGEGDHDERRAAVIVVIVEALRGGFVVPADPTTPESDYGSTAGLVFEAIEEAGFEIRERRPKRA